MDHTHTPKMSSSPVNEDADSLLAALRKAASNKANALSNLSRLRRYSRMTPGMKADERRHREILNEAEKLIDHVLLYGNNTLPVPPQDQEFDDPF